MMSKVFCPPNAIFLVDGRTVHLSFPGVFVLPEIDELMYILHPSSSLLRERADLLRRRRRQWRNGIPTAAATAWRRGACGFPAAGLVEEAEIGGALQLHKAQYPSHARIPLADPFSPCHATTEKCGSGVVTEEDIRQGDFVIEYVGEEMLFDRIWKVGDQIWVRKNPVH
ncbi:hypothetical protein BHE74_00016116 [Ensete ventricosum]|nr:hypothetical protein BHE74_00016116 [Ensete ventricosum]RZS21736.1 hypothetical protein BHM03_00054409 [Ensete ventricosum]